MSLALPEFRPGTVWLVGAGPGDPGLLTLLAAHALAAADHVVHDALVDRRILALAAPGAELESMGKRGGADSPKQAAITARLIELAQAGKRVLRLKGGDPFVFGRGPEEAQALAAANIAFRIVPGITAGIGGLAYAGIPVTAKECNSTVTFVTGHGPDGDLPPDVDWDKLGAGSQVLVFYMAVRQLEKLAARLIKAGRPGTDPVALVSKAASPDQAVLISDLERIAADAAARPLPAPALIVVGPVVGLASVLDWWDGA
ncbi:uroporphyrinogen-III C-methyltransferase [Magnetospirillum moscoviense]|uniref:uroporphyrinogen-III C-methyltransferase n=1 Tax=Magnetospirillum moscoviense TaxID=1437059 RepID=UPI000838AF6E|nr:uroporphyrinogen-III C-methyltransferase [Magnetospirillum moscoviense]